MVYVLSEDGKPLMPCSAVIARLLLKQGKAKVKRRTHAWSLAKHFWKERTFWSDGDISLVPLETSAEKRFKNTSKNKAKSRLTSPILKG